MKSLLTPEHLPRIPNLSSLNPLAQTIEPQLLSVSQDTSQALILARIDELPEQTLDLLAWQLHADFYDLAYSIDIKRRTVKGSLLWHMKKGTVAAIIEALNLIDIDAKFVHWKDIPDGKPYTFNITAIVAGDFYRTRGKDRLASSIRRAVSAAKSERSYMAQLDIHIEPEESVGLYTFSLWARNFDISLGLEKNDMHELLLMFEKRIIDKLVSYGERFTEKMNSFSFDLTRKLQDTVQTITDRVDTSEADITRRINSCEENSARMITECETQTARLISECEASTTTRLKGYLMRVEQYEYRTEQYFEEIIEQVNDLRSRLEWLNADYDAEEYELNGQQKGVN